MEGYKHASSLIKFRDKLGYSRVQRLDRSIEANIGKVCTRKECSHKLHFTDECSRRSQC